MDGKLRVAICQNKISPCREENLRKAAEMVAAAARNGSDMAVLPEMFSLPYEADLALYAENYPGETSRFLSDLARNHKLLLVGGSIPVKDADGRIYNCSYVFGQNGALLGAYKKTHLFDIDIPGRVSFRESDVFSPGNELPVIEWKGLRFSVLICYDIRFPELSRVAVLGGACLLIVPAAFSYITGQDHWELLIRTRAVDNQVFIAAASPACNPAANYRVWGHSMIVDPWGRILGEAGQGEEMIYADLDFKELQRIRTEMPLLAHRRTDLYKPILP